MQEKIFRIDASAILLPFCGPGRRICPRFLVSHFKTLPNMQVLDAFLCFPIQQLSGNNLISAVRRE